MVSKVNYCFLKVYFLMFLSACGFHVNGQYVEVSKCAMHLGHSISSGDRTEIVTFTKGNFWSSFNIFRADFGHISSRLNNVLFQKYGCAFYGSPLWPLEGAMIQSLCVEWRKSLRCVWSLIIELTVIILLLYSISIPLF